jgi:hypothetical protein
MENDVEHVADGWTNDRSVVQSVQLDDASPLVTYTGFSPVGGSSSPQGVKVDPTDYSSTLSMTTSAGASASVTFRGTST